MIQKRQVFKPSFVNNTNKMSEKTKYQIFIDEIESLSKIYKFSAMQKLTLNLAASFKCNELDYDKLKEEFINETKSS